MHSVLIWMYLCWKIIKTSGPRAQAHAHFQILGTADVDYWQYNVSVQSQLTSPRKWDARKHRTSPERSFLICRNTLWNTHSPLGNNNVASNSSTIQSMPKDECMFYVVFLMIWNDRSGKALCFYTFHIRRKSKLRDVFILVVFVTVFGKAWM